MNVAFQDTTQLKIRFEISFDDCALHLKMLWQRCYSFVRGQQHAHQSNRRRLDSASNAICERHIFISSARVLLWAPCNVPFTTARYFNISRRVQRIEFKHTLRQQLDARLSCVAVQHCVVDLHRNNSAAVACTSACTSDLWDVR